MSSLLLPFDGLERAKKVNYFWCGISDHSRRTWTWSWTSTWSVADQGSGRGVWTPLLAHDVGFLTLGLKLPPPCVET